MENNDSETSIVKNSPFFAMWLNIPKAYEMLQFSESKADTSAQWKYQCAATSRAKTLGQNSQLDVITWTSWKT